MFRHPAFGAGIRDMLVVCAGLAAWGVMTGVAMVKSGMHLVEVLMMATLVFAGSSQLAALPLMVAGAPMWVVLAAAFCVNLRFVVFSAHLRPYAMHRRFAMRVLGGYLMADVNYGLFTRRFPEPSGDPVVIEAQDAYWFGLGITSWAGWTGASLAGVALGDAVPLAWGLGFAGILALLSILCALTSTPLRAVSAGVAGVAAVAAYALPLRLNIVVAIATAVAVCLLLETSGGVMTSTWRKRRERGAS